MKVITDEKFLHLINEMYLDFNAHKKAQGHVFLKMLKRVVNNKRISIEVATHIYTYVYKSIDSFDIDLVLLFQDITGLTLDESFELFQEWVYIKIWIENNYTPIIVDGNVAGLIEIKDEE